MFNKRLKKRVDFLEKMTEIQRKQITALMENNKELTKCIKGLYEVVK